MAAAAVAWDTLWGCNRHSSLIHRRHHSSRASNRRSTRPSNTNRWRHRNYLLTVLLVIKISIPSTCHRLSSSSSNITNNHHQQCIPAEWFLRGTTYQNRPTSTACWGLPVYSKRPNITSQRPSTVHWVAINRISCPPR